LELITYASTSITTAYYCVAAAWGLNATDLQNRKSLHSLYRVTTIPDIFAHRSAWLPIYYLQTQEKNQ